MSKTKRPLLLLALVIALLAIPTFVVFAKELGSLTISGPGIKGDLTLSDPKYMMNLQESGFFDQTSLIKPPENLNINSGYSITAHLNLDGKSFLLFKWFTTQLVKASQAMFITPVV